MNMKWNFSDHRDDVYNHSGFQIIVSIQFVVFLLEITFQQFQYFMFFMPCKISRKYCKISLKGKPLKRAISIFFCAFHNRFKDDFAATRLFSLKAFHFFYKNCGTVIRFIVSVSFFYFFRKISSRNFM